MIISDLNDLCNNFKCCHSRYSNWLQAGLPRGRILSPSRVKSFLHFIQTSSGAHPASYPMGMGGFSPGGVKRQGPEADHSPPASAMDKKIWIYTFVPPYAFMA
jgi:hypothetical protein